MYRFYSLVLLTATQNTLQSIPLPPSQTSTNEDLAGAYKDVTNGVGLSFYNSRQRTLTDHVRSRPRQLVP